MAKIRITGVGDKPIDVEVSTLAQEDTLQRLLKIMDVTGKANTINTQNSQRAVDGLGDAASGAADALENTATTFDEASDAVEAAASNMKDASAKFRKDLSSSMFTNTKSLFSGMSTPMEFLKDSAKGLGSGFEGLLKASASSGGAMSGMAGNLLKFMGPIGLAFTALYSVLGFMIGRAKKNIEMYDNTLKAGATFAGGMEEFRSTVTNSSLNLDDFNSVISKNAVSFAQFGGSVGQGAIKFSAVSKEVGKYGVQFRNLGYSAEEMGGIQADYMVMLQQSGELTGKNARSDAEVAKGAMGYAANLKLMSAYTGKSIEQLKAEQAEKARDVKYMLAARQKAKDTGMTYTQAMQSIQGQVARAPALEAVILSQAKNRGKLVGAEAAMLGTTLKGTTAALLAEQEAEAAARREGTHTEEEINVIKAKAFAAHKDQIDADIAEGSRAEAFGDAFSAGLSTSGDAVAQAMAQVQDLSTMAGTMVATTEAQNKTQKDTQGLAAKNNLASATMYDANKRLLDVTDDLALKGMALFQDAIMKFAVAVFKMFHITMPKSLQEFSDSADAAAKAAELKAKADREAAAAKVAEEKTGAMDPAMIAAVTKTVMQQGTIGYMATKQAGLFGETDKVERKAGESDADYNKRSIDEIKKALLARSADPKFAGNIKMELDANIAKLRQTDMGKGMNDEELHATLKAMYKQQGLAISDDFKRIMTLEQKQAEDAAAAEKKAREDEAAARKAGIETPPVEGQTATAAPSPPGGAEVPGTPGAAKGGVLKGSKKGFPATLHGTEAVVPLPDNKTIPVSIDFPPSLLSSLSMSSVPAPAPVPVAPPEEGILSQVGTMSEKLLSSMADFFSSKPEKPPITDIDVAFLNAMETQSSTIQEHTIKQGETLDSIAKKANTSIEAIMQANPQITNRNKIRAGQKINMPEDPNSRVADITAATIATALEAQIPEPGSMTDSIRAGFESASKDLSAMMTAINPTDQISAFAESIAKMTETSSTGTTTMNDVRAAMLEVRDLLKSQNTLLTDLLDHTKTGVRVQKDIRNINF